MAIVQDIEQIQEFTQNYWFHVQKVLVQVFNWTLEASNGRIDEAIKDLEELDSDAQILFYHAEPFDVAEDFACEALDEFDINELITKRDEWTATAEEKQL